MAIGAAVRGCLWIRSLSEAAPWRLGDGEEVDGLEQVALSSAVASLDEDEAGAELEAEAPVVAKVEEIKAGQVDGVVSGGCSGLWIPAFAEMTVFRWPLLGRVRGGL